MKWGISPCISKVLLLVVFVFHFDLGLSCVVLWWKKPTHVLHCRKITSVKRLMPAHWVQTTNRVKKTKPQSQIIVTPEINKKQKNPDLWPDLDQSMQVLFFWWFIAFASQCIYLFFPLQKPLCLISPLPPSVSVKICQSSKSISVRLQWISACFKNFLKLNIWILEQ